MKHPLYDKLPNIIHMEPDIIESTIINTHRQFNKLLSEINSTISIYNPNGIWEINDPTGVYIVGHPNFPLTQLKLGCELYPNKANFFFLATINRLHESFIIDGIVPNPYTSMTNTLQTYIMKIEYKLKVKGYQEYIV